MDVSGGKQVKEVTNGNSALHIETAAFRKSVELLNTQGIIVVVGSAGTGKTTIGQQLMSYFSRKLKALQVFSLDELQSRLKENQFYLFDDSFGNVFQNFKLGHWENFGRQLRELRSEKQKPLPNTFIVLTTRRDFLPKTLPFQHESIDMEDEVNSLDMNEKIGIMKIHNMNEDASNVISAFDKYQGNHQAEMINFIGFPMCCSQYDSYFKGIAKAIEFFENPLFHILNRFKKILEVSHTARLFCRSIVMHDGLLNTNEQNITHEIIGFITINRNNVLQFIHPSISIVAELNLYDEDKDIALEHISLTTLARITKANEKENTTLHNITDAELSELHFPKIAERVLNEIIKGNIKAVCQLEIWSRETFLVEFEKLILHKSKDDTSIACQSLFSAADNVEGDGVIFWAAAVRKPILCKRLLTIFANNKMHLMTMPPSVLSRPLIKSIENEFEMEIVRELVELGANINYCGACIQRTSNIDIKNNIKNVKHYCPLEAAIVVSHNRKYIFYLSERCAEIPHSSWRRWDLLSSISQKSDFLSRYAEFMLALECVFSKYSDQGELPKSDSPVFRTFVNMLKEIHDTNDINHIFFVFISYKIVNKAIVSAFVKCGLDVKYRDAKDQNVVDILLRPYKNNPRSIPRHIIASIEMLLDMKADPNNIASDGNFPLALAIGSRNADTNLLEVLLKCGADPDKKTVSGYTPLHICIMSDMLNSDKCTITTLLRKYNVDLTILDRRGKTYSQIVLEKSNASISLLDDVAKFPIHDSLDSDMNEEKKIQFIEELSKTTNYKRDINCQDVKHRTPLLIAACDLLSKPLTKTILSLGAKPEILFECDMSIIQQLLLSQHENVSDILDILLEYTKVVHHKNVHGDNALMTALKSKRKRYAEIKFMLNKCDFEIFEERNNNLQTFLHLVVSCEKLNDEEACNLCSIYLSHSHLSLHDRDDFEKNVLDYAASCLKNRTETISLLLKEWKDFDIGSKFMLDITEHGHISDTISCILQQKSYYIQVIEHDKFILHKLASTKPVTKKPISLLLKHLLSVGININIKDKEGNTPLTVACKKNNFSVVSVLVKLNADLHEQNQLGNSALHEAILNFDDDIVLNKICILFANKNFDFSIRNNDGNSVLHLLVTNRLSERTETLQTLLSMQLHYNQRDIDGNTVLHKIVMVDREDSLISKWIETIFQSTKHIDIHLKGKYGQTAFHMACSYTNYSRLNTMLMLLKYGSNVNDKDTRGQTTLDSVVKSLEGHELAVIFERFSRVVILFSAGYNQDVATAISLSKNRRYINIESLLKNSDKENVIKLMNETVEKLQHKFKKKMSITMLKETEVLLVEIYEIMMNGYLRISDLTLDVNIISDNEDLVVDSDYILLPQEVDSQINFGHTKPARKSPVETAMLDTKEEWFSEESECE